MCNRSFSHYNLPPFLWDEIFSLISPEEVSALRLACRDWMLLINPFIFHHINFTKETYSNPVYHRRFLNKNGKYFEGISVTTIQTKLINGIANTFPRLVTLVISLSSFGSIEDFSPELNMPCIERLKSLVFIGQDYSMAKRILPKFPRLETLHLKGHYFSIEELMLLFESSNISLIRNLFLRVKRPTPEISGFLTRTFPYLKSLSLGFLDSTLPDCRVGSLIPQVSLQSFSLSFLISNNQAIIFDPQNLGKLSVLQLDIRGRSLTISKDYPPSSSKIEILSLGPSLVQFKLGLDHYFPALSILDINFSRVDPKEACDMISNLTHLKRLFISGCYQNDVTFDLPIKEYSITHLSISTLAPFSPNIMLWISRCLHQITDIEFASDSLAMETTMSLQAVTFPSLFRAVFKHETTIDFIENLIQLSPNLEFVHIGSRSARVKRALDSEYPYIKVEPYYSLKDNVFSSAEFSKYCSGVCKNF
ncbi:hypothetical protein DSO57_1024529 [Entomophthora muscae]|uniref:Uncharacterized protein n=1 Tax=Entomophthora muscae TaxID=34485 RepID=A0ACC2TDZ5_9FUNG|nr:hypothetical protein DSO57_1024529 [Entomophthora muscae]